jgi:hypothetical protein
VRRKAWKMREARPGGCARQGRGCERHGRVDARGKAGRIREARHDRCATQGRADARVKAGQIGDAKQVTC